MLSHDLGEAKTRKISSGCSRYRASAHPEPLSTPKKRAASDTNACGCLQTRVRLSDLFDMFNLCFFT